MLSRIGLVFIFTLFPLSVNSAQSISRSCLLNTSTDKDAVSTYLTIKLITVNGKAVLYGAIKSESGEPIPEALVTVKRVEVSLVSNTFTKSSISNRQGLFFIPDLDSGNYVASVKAPNYKPTEEQSFQISPETKSKELNFNLEPDEALIPARRKQTQETVDQEFTRASDLENWLENLSVDGKICTGISSKLDKRSTSTFIFEITGDKRKIDYVVERIDGSYDTSELDSRAKNVGRVLVGVHSVSKKRHFVVSHY